MDKVRVSRAVARLYGAGLITRDQNPSDRREAILDLTSAGREVHQQIVPLARQIEAELTAGLSREERAALEKALTKIEGSSMQAA